MPAQIVNCAVDRVDATRLDVSWEVVGPATAVEIAHGPSPASIDHRKTVSVAAGTTTLRLDGISPGPVFVSVSDAGGAAAVVCGTRRILLDGPTNFRDLGGFDSAFGGRTRWGMVFRSDALHSLSSVDLAGLEALGLRAVYDLRGDRERTELPNPIDSIQYEVVGRPRVVPGPDEPAPEPDFTKIPDGEKMLRDIYIGMLEHSPVLFGEMFTGMSDQSRLPAVFHCHAGKDRTGMTAALLLLALGVAADDVLDDYASSAQYWDGSRSSSGIKGLVERGLSPEAAAGLLGAPRWAMAEAVDALDDEYGGIEKFLLGPGRMTAGTLDHLRSALLS